MIKILEFDLSQIKFSKWDKIFNVKLPITLSSDLAYETGIHIGDGSMPLHKSRPNIYYISYSGNYLNEIFFYKKIVKPLIKKIYNKDVDVIRKRKNECRIEIRSKAIFQFKNKILGLPIGPKGNIDIPSVILSTKRLAFSCLRGIADTDFSLVFLKRYRDVSYYPKIKGDSKSKLLIEQIENILKKYLHVKPVVSYNVKRFDKRTGKTTTINTIELNGKKNLKLWMRSIGFNNTQIITKYMMWKRLKYVPDINVDERIKLLETM